MSWLDRLPEFNNKAILVQSTLGYKMAMAYLGGRDIGLELDELGITYEDNEIDDISDDDGPFNGVVLASPNEDLFDLLSDQITWFNQLLGVSNDTDQSEDTRLKCLTELVDHARLNEVPLLPYNPVIMPQTDIPPSALVIHNETTGIEGVGFLHIGPVELAKINSARQTPDSFAEITGAYTDNASLVGGFATKEGIITPSNNAAQFWNGTKTFAAVGFNQLTGVPTTLAGYGVSASDNLFDNKYLQLGSQLQTLSTVTGTPLTTTTTVIEGFGSLQNQVSARELSLGNPAVNGYILSSTTAGVRSWIPAPTGTAVTNISLTGTNGITGSVVITTGNAVITAGTNVSGILIGDGTAISAATEMTDYIGITGATNGDTILFTGGVATWAPGLSNPMTLLGDIIYGGASGATTRLAGNTTTTNKFLRSTGVASLATAPSWEALVAGDIPDIAISQVTSLQASLDNKLDDTLTSAYMFVGNGAGAAVGVAMSGDGTLSNTGALTIANDAITFAKMQNATAQGVLIGRWNAGVGDFQEVAVDGTTIVIDAFGVMSSTGGGGTPGGVTGQIQWNNTTFGGIDRAYSDGSNVFIQAGFFSLTDDASAPDKQVVFDVSAITAATTRTWAFPDASDTFVGLTATQALTGKTYNGLTISTSTGTLAIASGKTATISNTLTFTGTDGSSVAFGAGGTVAYVGLANSWTAGIKQTFAPSATTAGINVGSVSGDVSTPVNGDLWYDSTGNLLRAYINGAAVSLGAGGGGGANTALSNLASVAINTALLPNVAAGFDFGSTTLPWKDIWLAGTSGTPATNKFLITGASTGGIRTITLPNLSGTVALLDNAASFSSLISTTSLTLGVAGPSGGTTGQIILRNSTNANLVTLQAGATAGGSITYTLPTTAPTAGQVLISTAPSSGVAALSWSTLTTTTTLSNIGAATVAGSLLNNANFALQWAWNSLTTQAGLTLSSSTLTTGSVLSILVTGTAHTTAGAGLIVSASGPNTAAATTTTSASFSNTRTGGTSTNIALSLSASGGTTNYALDVAAGIVRLGVGTTLFPQMVFTPSAGIALPGSTNGSLIYDTVSSNSSLSLYKDVAYTKLVTIARNPDFVSSTNGVVISDASGNLTKSGELTAFGIFSGTADGTALTASGNADLLPTTVVGSKTLPASFFGIGKTIEVFVSGKITTINSPGSLVLKLQFGSTPTDIATITLPLHHNITNGYWDARFIVVCRTTGATGGISANGVARMETDTNANMVYGDVVVPAVLPTINTAAAQDIKVNGAITVSNSVTIQNCYANYLN